MRRRTGRCVAGGAATALLALALPLGSPAAAEDYVGFTTEGSATPVRIAVYEPTIPIPASPQFELNFSFSRVRSQTGQLSGLASYAWPGDSLGTGFKTFGEQLGLPAAITGGGYPVQVNATYPGGAKQDRQEPFPGVVMRTRAGEREVRSQAGFAMDQDVSEGHPADGGKGRGGLPSLPAIPGLPELPGLSSLPLLGGGGVDAAAGGGDSPDGGAPPKGDGGSGGSAGGIGEVIDSLLSGGLLKGLTGGENGAPTPGIPPALSALVDVGGMASTSRTTLGDRVTTVSRSALGDISIAGGLVTMEGVSAVAKTSGDGAAARTRATARVGGLRIAGQLMAIDEGGITAPGTDGLPGLSGTPLQALEKLGITISLPGVTKEKDGRSATGAAEALRIEIDTIQLRGMLDILPLVKLTDALPEEAAELKKLLGTVRNLAPRIVVVLGSARSSTQTVAAFDIPAAGGAPEPAPEARPTQPPAAGAGTTTGGGPGSAAGGSPPAGPPPTDAGAAGSPAPALPESRLTSAGLPPLTTIPGLLTWGGLALGTAAGFWLRRMGMVVLGGGIACAHGHETGLPDLRKA